MSRLFTTGTTDLISIQPSASINNLPAHTIMAWLKIASFGEFQDIVWYSRRSSGAGTYFALTDGVFYGPPAGAYAMYMGVDMNTTHSYSQSNNPDDVLPIGEWAHLAYTLDLAGDKLAHIFINGVEISSYEAQTEIAIEQFNDSARPAIIGAIPEFGDTASTIDGRVFDFRIYDTQLSGADLLAIVAGGPTTNPAGSSMVCQLVFDQEGATEPDASGNGNDGAITGATFNADNPSFGPTAYSFPDCRDYATFPNNSRNVQDTLLYDVSAFESRTAGAPVDSRAAGALVDSRIAPNIPMNSRTDPPF